MSDRLSMAETELALSEQKVSDFNSTVNRLKAEMQEMAANHANDIRREKEVHISRKLKIAESLHQKAR